MGGYSDGFIDDVRSRVSLFDLISKDVKLTGKGGEFVGLCPFHSEATPSFTVSETKGFYHCFGCGAHGDCFDYIRNRHGVSFPEAVEELAIRVGLQADRDGHQLPEAKPVARPTRAELEETRLEKIQKARRIWDESQSVAGTYVERYLRSRNIDLDKVPGWPIPTLRFHPSLPCWCKVKDKSEYEYFGNFPAMIAYVQGPDGGFVGIHRTFLARDGYGKAPVPSAKQMLGDTFGGYCRLCRATPDMRNAEGLETSLSIAMTGKTIWAALSEGNLGAEMPGLVRMLTICADNDTKCQATTNKRLNKAAHAHAARGVSVRVAMPPRGMDFNDLLARGM